MAPIWMIPFAILAGEKNPERRKKVSQALVPSMFGLPPAQQVPISAITAVQQVRSAELREQEVVSNVVTTLAEAAAKAPGSKEPVKNDDLKNTPILAEVVRLRPELLTRINSVVLQSDKRAGIQSQQVANQMITAIDVASEDSNNELTDAELDKLPQLKAIIAKVPDLRQRIVGVAQSADGGGLATEVISAVRLAITTEDNKLTEQHLEDLPHLRPVVVNIPALRTDIDGLASSSDAKRLAPEVIQAISLAAANDDNTLHEDQLENLKRLKSVWSEQLRDQVNNLALTADAKNLSLEVVEGITLAAANEDNTLHEDQLENLKRLKAIISDELHSAINSAALAAEAKHQVASQVIDAINLAAKNKDNKLTDAQLATLKGLEPVMNIALRDRIDSLANVLP